MILNPWQRASYSGRYSLYMTVFLPPPDTNPYLTLLAAALEQCQVTVRAMPVVLSEQWLSTPRSSTQAVLHFHWPSYSYAHSNRARMVEYVRSWAQILVRAKALGFQIVWTVHNLYPHEQIHNDLEHEARQLLLDSCDSVIVHCHAAIPLLQARFNIKAKCAVIQHGHYCGIYGKAADSAEARQTLGIPQQGTVYLFFGQLRPYKGLEGLVRLFSSLPENLGTLLIAGPTLDAALARKLIGQSRCRRNIIVHPFFIPDREVSLYFGAGDVLVLPYADVLTSGTAVLAHSMGRPVIAPLLGCLPEMVPAGTGWLYDANSDDGLRKALELSQGPLNSATSERCINFALLKEWRGVAEKTIKVYSDLP